MKSSIICFLTVASALCSSIQAAPSTGDKRLQLKLVRHQPCTSKWHPNEKIRFSNITNAPLVKDEQRGVGCYTLSGPVEIRHGGISGTVQVYVQGKTGIKAPIEKCSKADKNGCGGVGSCVYCDVCAAKEQFEKQTSGFVTVEQNGKPLDCSTGLTDGIYKDIRLSFCLPTKKELQDVSGVTDDLWNEGGDGGHTFFLSIYVFNKPVNKYSTSELQKIATDDSTETVGCHRLVGNVREADS